MKQTSAGNLLPWETPVVGTQHLIRCAGAILCCLLGENMYDKQAKPAIKGLMGSWPLHFNFTHIGYCIIQHLWSSLLVLRLSYVVPFRQLNEWTTTSWIISIKIKLWLLIHANKNASWFSHFNVINLNFYIWVAILLQIFLQLHLDSSLPSILLGLPSCLNKQMLLLPSRSLTVRPWTVAGTQ